MKPWEKYQTAPAEPPTASHTIMNKSGAREPTPTIDYGEPSPAAIPPGAPERPMVPWAKYAQPGQTDRYAKDMREIGALDTGSLATNLGLRLRTMFSGDPEELATVVTKALPEAQLLRDPENNPVIQYKGQTVALNRPGFSLQDVVPVGTAIAENAGLAFGAPSGMFAGPLLSRVLTQSGLGALTGLGNAVARDQAGGDLKGQDYATELAAGAAGSAGGELLASYLARVLLPLRGGIRQADGRLTAEAADAFSQAGIDPGGLPPALLNQLDDALRGRQVTPETVAAARRSAVADQYGMPLSKGEATRDLKQLTVEEAMRQGAKGSRAQQIMQGFRGQQVDQAGNVIETVAGRVSPDAVIANTEATLGDVVGQGVRGREAAAAQRVNQLYDRFRELQREAPVVLPPDAPASLLPAARDALNERAIDATLAPGTHRILSEFQQLQGQSLDLLQSEVVRKRINSAIRSATSNEDEAAARSLLRTYDNWVDAQVRSLPNIYPQGTLDALRQARSAARQRFSTFEASGPHDAGGKLIERIVDGTIEPQQAVDRIMGGTRGLDSSGAQVARRLRGVLGDGSQEWQTVQRGMIRRILLGGADQQATGFPEWKTMLDRVNRALAGRGEASTAEALGGHGTAELEQLRELLRSLEVPPEALNRSGSGWRLMEALRPYTGGGAGAAVGAAYDALAKYGVVPELMPGAATIGGAFAGRGIQDVASALRALQATRGYTAPLRPLVPYSGSSGSNQAISAIAAGLAVGR